MQQVLSVWSALDVRRRIVVVVATVAVFAAVLGLSRLASMPGFALLYSGLESSAAGDVVVALEQRGVAYEIRGGAIYVDAARRDELRMTLAAEGLPANGNSGYELLDSLSGFGTTSQMFDAAYWRAKEGELARTIVASPTVRAARVHISSTQATPFRRDLRPTASVAVTTGQGGLSTAQVKAMQYLVASAVAGMTPENVSVIDSQVGLLSGGEDTAVTGAAADRALALKQNVERLLAARVGYGRALVEVSIDTVTEREAITERLLDPDSRVALTTDNENRDNSTQDSNRGGEVTVASNLPDGDAAAGQGTQSRASESRERTSFQVSETQREVVRNPGAVRRISVAVLVDGLWVEGDDGQMSWQPRPEEELAALHELVASAVGFDAARGDVVTLKSMQLQNGTEGSEASAPSLLRQFDLMALTQIAVLAFVVLVLGLFVLRPILSGRRQPVAPRQTPNLPAPAAATGAAATLATHSPRVGAQALTGEIDDGELPPDALMVVPRDRNRPPAAEPADPVARLRKLIAERQDETVEILRGWIEDEEEPA